MLALNGNTAVYLLYAYARLCGKAYLCKTIYGILFNYDSHNVLCTLCRLYYNIYLLLIVSHDKL